MLTSNKSALQELCQLPGVIVAAHTTQSHAYSHTLHLPHAKTKPTSGSGSAPPSPSLPHRLNSVSKISSPLDAPPLTAPCWLPFDSPGRSGENEAGIQCACAVLLPALSPLCRMAGIGDEPGMDPKPSSQLGLSDGAPYSVLGSKGVGALGVPAAAAAAAAAVDAAVPVAAACAAVSMPCTAPAAAAAAAVSCAAAASCAAVVAAEGQASSPSPGASGTTAAVPSDSEASLAGPCCCCCCCCCCCSSGCCSGC